ncbi:hypothetical protein [Metakosakonia massiliensis]|uniref:Uncharacterized protein n=1 Tax=Phytobacter massiliensis TaxID=1485952 RepID=A0A6N3H4X6_9ENTR
MEENLSEYIYLWDGSEPGWALFNLADEGCPPIYIIQNTITKIGLIIEDENEENQVIKRMLNENVKIINDTWDD